MPLWECTQEAGNVSDDREIARRNLDRQARERDYALMVIPGYSEWSERKLQGGESPAFIAHLDSMSMWLLPEEVPTVGEAEFEELLAEVKEDVAKCERSWPGTT
jgi:hypothetical protein